VQFRHLYLNKLSWLLLLLPLFFLACSKGTDEGPKASTANFSITGLKDVDMSTTPSNSYTFPISIQSVAGAVDTVTLYANELPSGLYVHFVPVIGVTPFTSYVTITAQTQGAGTYTVKIKGVGLSGLRTYDLKITVPEFRGWKLGSTTYHRQSVVKSAGGSSSPATILVNASGGAILILTFAPGAPLPSSTSTYSISSEANSSNEIAIQMIDGAHTWESTGGGTASGTFTFENGKFSFKCSNVEMMEGTERKMISCIFSE
jgi:hypothetical protein